MNKVELKQICSKMKFNIIKHSPEILKYVGVAGVLASYALAYKAAIKVDEKIKASKNTINKIHDTVKDESIEYSELDAKNDLKILYATTTLDIAKAYIPVVAVGGLGLGCLIQSNHILKNRNVALTAALTTTTEMFKRYRKNVVDKYGEQVDHELRYDLKTEKVTTQDENGKEKKEEIQVTTGELSKYSDYARFYDESCADWTKDPEYNLMFLKAQQQYANDKLVAKGYLFLNEVYSMLGIPETKAGQIVGWIYNTDNPVGDNYVDFGIFDINKPKARDFVNGYERTILLDFNVDGNIWDKM